MAPEPVRRGGSVRLLRALHLTTNPVEDLEGDTDHALDDLDPVVGPPAESWATPGAPDVRQIPVHLIHGSPANPRTDLALDAEFVESIRSHGVLQPITVLPDPDDPDRFVIEQGHRRHAGAVEAGLATVTAIVRQDNAAEAAVRQMIENLQRVDLSPSDEARGYAQLRDRHGMTQTAIAEQVGRHQGHVSKRLALLRLPPPLLARVDSGELPLEVAVDAAKLTPVGLNVLADRLNATPADEIPARARAVLAEVATMVEEMEERAAVLAELRTAGVDVVELPAGRTTLPNIDYASGPVPLAHVGLGVAEHRGRPCRRVAVTGVKTFADGSFGWTVEYCTNPRNHARAGKASPVVEPLPAGGAGQGPDGEQQTLVELSPELAARAAEEERLRTVRELAEALNEARRAHITRTLAGRIPTGASAYVIRHGVLGPAIASETALEFATIEDAVRLLAPDADPHPRALPDAPGMAPLVEVYTSGSPEGRTRFALALVLASQLSTTHQAQTKFLEQNVGKARPDLDGFPLHDVVALLDFLSSNGYTLTAEEAELLASVEAAPAWVYAEAEDLVAPETPPAVADPVPTERREPVNA